MPKPMAFGDLGGCPKLSILVSLKFIDYQYEIVQLCSTDLFFSIKVKLVVLDITRRRLALVL